MRRYGCMLLGAAMVVAICGAAGAASEQAMKLRSQNGLSEFAPPEAFLAGNFLADETDPAFIFGKVRDFVKSLACPATWLIEEGERKRIEARGQSSDPVEYSIYLEADCPGKVTYYIFVDRSINSAQWLEWRRQFHKKQDRPPLRGGQGQPGPGRPERVCGGRRAAVRGTQRRPAAEAAGRDPHRRAQVPADLRSQEKPGTDQVTRNGLPHCGADEGAVAAFISIGGNADG